MSATIRDIKDKTGLSLATISKYLNGGNVLPENKVKIEAAIKSLHYEVNEIARSMITNKTRTVGVLMHNVESPFSGQIMHFISMKLRESGYGMLICDSCNDTELEAKNLRYLINKKVDGIICVPVATTSDFLKPAGDADIPVILMDRSLSDGVHDCIRIDNRASVLRAMDVLLSNNHKKVAIIASEHEYTGRERLGGFLDALKRVGIEAPKEYIKLGEHSLESGYKYMKELLELKNRPTAVFAGNYEITLGAMMAINESDYKCPEDISVLGFDDQLIFHLLEPPIYMVQQPLQQMSNKAVETLLDRIQNGLSDIPMEIAMHTSIHEGRSVKSLK